MKKFDDLLKILNKYNITYSNSLNENLIAPYGIWKRENEDIIYANNTVYFSFFTVKIEFYYINLKKQLELEKQLENELNKHGYIFVKSEEQEIDEKIKTIDYTIKQIGG